jgi:hypothetical protein
MAGDHHALRDMKAGTQKTCDSSRHAKWGVVFYCPLVLLLLCCTWIVLAQSTPTLPKGRFTKFVFPEYHEPPNDSKLKSTLKGEVAVPQDGGWLRIEQLRVDTYNLDGTPGFVLEADECDYNNDQGRAWSQGPIRMRTADERFALEGYGFHWQAEPSTLTISNRVHTVIRGGLQPLREP